MVVSHRGAVKRGDKPDVGRGAPTGLSEGGGVSGSCRLRLEAIGGLVLSIREGPRTRALKGPSLAGRTAQAPK